MTESRAVLLVEDHPLVRQSVVMALQQARAGEIREAQTAAEALSLAEQTAFEMAVLDLRLADGNGLDLAPRLKALGVAKILVLTASDDQFTVRAAFQAGVDGYLLKSSPASVVAEGITRVLAGEIFTDPAVASVLVQSLRSPGTVMEELTAREKELLGLVAKGLTNKDIAAQLYMSPATVKSNLARVGRKLGASDRSEMVAIALRANLLD